MNSTPNHMLSSLQTDAAQPGSISRRSALVLGSTAAMLLGSLKFAPQASAADGTDFAAARHQWQAALVGEKLDAADPAIAARLRTVSATATKWQASMSAGAGSTTLWADLTLGAKSGPLSTTAQRILDMALGWAAVGSTTFHDPALEQAIIDSLTWYTSKVYTPTTASYDNWYEWIISIPQALNDTAVLLFDRLDAKLINTIIGAQVRQVAELPTTGTKAAAANLALIIDGYSGRAVLAGDMATVTKALTALASLLVYAKPTGGPVGLLNGGNVGAINGGQAEIDFFSNDGFYPDGSFIQHGQFPYAGGYGTSFLTSLVATIVRTTPLGASLDTDIVFNWIHESFEPFLWNGLMMDTVRGRNVAFTPDGDHTTGHGILAACMPLLATAQGEARKKLAGMIKHELQADSADDPMSKYSLPALSTALQLLADPATPARGPLVKTQVFGAMDRILHRRESFATALAMNSWRMSNYETGSNQNLAAWYTADGALWLYNQDLAQFDNGYWFTVDPYRMPGTTVDTVARTRKNIPWRAEYHNPDFWAGGVEAGNWGAAGFRFKGESPSTLSCRKSWFFFGEEVLCLGEGITAATGRTVETILENRRTTATASAAITVDGGPAASAAGSVELFPAAAWAHLDGVAGFVFAQPAAVSALRETRSGTLKDITPGSSSPVMTNTFSTLWLDHTATGTDSYAYTMLPNATPEATAEHATHPTVRVLAQTPAVHAARQEPFGRTAATFFEAGSASFITAAQACAVAVEEQDTELLLSLCDPTQTANRIEVELDVEAGAIVSADPGVTVSSREGRLVVSADVSGSVGGSRHVRIRYSLTPESVAALLKRKNKAGDLAKEPYKQLENCLKQFAKSLRKGQPAAADYAALTAALAANATQIPAPEFALIDDLVSRLAAKAG